MSAKNWKEALADPDLHYDSPSAVSRTYALRDDEKIELLQAWERNTRQLMVAEGEGMIAADNRTGRAAVLLKEIHAALAKLGEQYTPDRVPSDTSDNGVRLFIRRLLQIEE